MTVRLWITVTSNATCDFSSYCSFVPGNRCDIYNTGCKWKSRCLWNWAEKVSNYFYRKRCCGVVEFFGVGVTPTPFLTLSDSSTPEVLSSRRAGLPTDISKIQRAAAQRNFFSSLQKSKHFDFHSLSINSLYHSSNWPSHGN